MDLIKRVPGARSRVFPQVGNMKNFVISIINLETFFPHWLWARIKHDAFVLPNVLP